MIRDQLAHAGLYESLSPRLAAAFRYLRETELHALAPGKYEVQGKDLFVIVDAYQTKFMDVAFWEAHRKYIDVQYIVSGVERMGYAPLQALQVIQAYDEEKDFMKLGDAAGAGEFLTLRAGEFVVFAPHDAHMPGLAAGAAAQVKKAVMKVRI